MLAISAEAPVTPHNYAIARDQTTREIRLHRPFQPSDRQVFTLTQRHFVVAGEHLVLEEPPQIAVFPGIFEFEIEGWNIRLPYDKKGEIGRELIRKFLNLHARAARIELNEQEEAEWAEISKRVDYQRFSIDRSVPRYIEGVLVNRDDQSCRVEWHDGTKDRLTGRVARALSLLEPGERFTAFGKFGANNSLVDITHVSPVPAIGDDDGERMWREWPVRQS